MNRIDVSPSSTCVEQELAKSTGSSRLFYGTVFRRASNAPTVSPRAAAGPARASAAPPRALCRRGRVGGSRRAWLARRLRPLPGGRAAAAAAHQLPSAGPQVVAERLVAAPAA